MNESYIERSVVAAAKKNGWFVRKVEWVGHVGAPDRVFIRGGLVLWVEFKAPGKKPRPTQVLEHEQMTKHGARVFVVDDVDAGLRLLKAYEE